MTSTRCRSALLVSLAACGSPAPSSPRLAAAELTLDFETDAAIDVGSEQYLCRVYDRGALAGSPLESIAWELAAAGPIAVHHVSLYALTQAPGPGRIDCASDGWGVGPRFSSFTPGQKVTTLPEGVALLLPDATRWIGVEVHLLRMGVGPSPPGRVVLHPAARAPEHLAVWMETNVHVPDLPPRSVTSSTRRCTAPADLHVVAAWPHMHRMGSAFDSNVTRARASGGTATTPLLHVSPWDFTHQPLYPENVVLGAGDTVDLTCTWQNTSDQTIIDGPYTSNEMCSFAFIAWPAEAAHCTD